MEKVTAFVLKCQ